MLFQKPLGKCSKCAKLRLLCRAANTTVKERSPPLKPKYTIRVHTVLGIPAHIEQHNSFK